MKMEFVELTGVSNEMSPDNLLSEKIETKKRRRIIHIHPTMTKDSKDCCLKFDPVPYDRKTHLWKKNYSSGIRYLNCSICLFPSWWEE